MTESESFDVERFIPLLQKYIRRANPYIRQLLVSAQQHGSVFLFFFNIAVAQRVGCLETNQKSDVLLNRQYQSAMCLICSLVGSFFVVRW